MTMRRRRRGRERERGKKGSKEVQNRMSWKERTSQTGGYPATHTEP